VGFSSVRALGRNPSAAPKILLAMILAFLFAESIAIIGLLIVYNLFGS
jgi:F0F1-type ATP synthase membrane subunit c/vacuolar-type H+-ATPase subunit K